MIKLLATREGWYIYPIYILDQAATGDISKITGGLKVEKSFYLVEGEKVSWYCEPESANQVGKYLLEKILKEKTFSQKVIDEIYANSTTLLDFCQKLKAENLEKLSDKELVDLYSEYVDKLRALRAWGWVPVFLEGFFKTYLTDYLQDNLRKVLSDENLEEKFSEYYTILSSSEKMSEVQGEELARVEMLIKFEKEVDLENPQGEFKKAQDEHLNDFGWLTYGYTGPQMSKEYLINLLKENLEKGNLSEQKREIENYYKDLAEEKEKIFQAVNLSEELKRIFKISAEFMYIKDFRKGIYQKSYVAMDQVLVEIGRRLELSLREIKFLILEEVKEALSKNEKQKYQEIIKERLKKCCCVTQDGVTNVYQGEEGESIIKKNLEEVEEEKENKNSEVKGRIAYQGIVKGTARIILSEKDLPRVQEGEILVSRFTDPDFISAMKKASAFVTESGGITSHAAIVARELKTPCVIGIKNATKLIKDGDLIEVDANEGVVKILK